MKMKNKYRDFINVVKNIINKNYTFTMKIELKKNIRKTYNNYMNINEIIFIIEI